MVWTIGRETRKRQLKKKGTLPRAYLHQRIKVPKISESGERTHDNVKRRCREVYEGGGSGYIG